MSTPPDSYANVDSATAVQVAAEHLRHCASNHGKPPAVQQHHYDLARRLDVIAGELRQNHWVTAVVALAAVLINISFLAAGIILVINREYWLGLACIVIAPLLRPTITVHWNKR